MKGIILAGGLGTRLQPLTKITNKHLLPVYNKPMILYPLETLKKSGITEILIVSGREYAGHFMNFLGSGKELGVKLSYALQDRDNGGIADALSCAEDYAGKDLVAVILGDNIFYDNFEKDVTEFKEGARVFFKKVSDPSRFGVPVFSDGDKKITHIEEKPEKPQSSYAQTGFYLFDSNVFSIIKTLKPSERGELEMTDIVNNYIKDERLTFSFVENEWHDAGTIESLFTASSFIREKNLKDL